MNGVYGLIHSFVGVGKNIQKPNQTKLKLTEPLHWLLNRTVILKTVH